MVVKILSQNIILVKSNCQFTEMPCVYNCKGPKLAKNVKNKMKENVFFVLVFSLSYQYWVPDHNNETLKSL